MPQKSFRSRVAIVVVLTAVGLPAALGAVAGAREAHGPSQHRVSTRFEIPAPVGTPIAELCIEPGQCISPYDAGVHPVKGDWNGTAVGGGTAVIATDKASSIATGVFSGTIEGCGTGVLFTTYRALYDVKNADAAQGGTWEVIRGFGHGLTTVTGGGKFAIKANADGSTPTSVWTGTLVCPKGR